MPPADRGHARARVDVDAVIDELSVLPPGEFVRARDRHVDAARAARDGEAVSCIRARRRPTLAAWACNLLVHDQPGEIEQFLRLGEELRRAHRDLDREQLRSIGGQQWQVISALARRAAQLARARDARITDAVLHEIETTLRAAVADQAAAEQFAVGHLQSSLTPPVNLPTTANAPTPSGEKTKASRKSIGDAAKPTGTDRAGERARAKQRRQEDARRQADEAEQLHRRARERAEQAKRTAEDARAAHAEARQQVDDLEMRLDRARTAAAAAGEEEDQAVERAEAAEREVAHAEREARRAARLLQRQQ